MYSGVAPPDSPASTSAASPGASWMMPKLSTAMTSSVGSAWSSRRSTNSGQRDRPMSRRDTRCAATSGLHPRAIERGVHSKGTHDRVLKLAVVHRREVELHDPHDRRGLDDDLLELVIERISLVRIGLDGRGLEQLVDLGRGPARAVDPRRSLEDRLRPVLALHADHRIG